MRGFVRRNVAVALAIVAVAASAVCLGAGADYINRYSLVSPYRASSNVYFGVQVTNQYTWSSSSSFRYSGALYNNVSNGLVGYTTSDHPEELGVNQGVSVTLRGYEAYAELPDQTRCENHLSCFAGAAISSSAVAYETYISPSYYNK